MQSGGSDAGAAGGVGGSTNKEGFSNAAFVTWLNTQFSESSDFDAKIAALTATLNQGLKEQADAAKAAMLAAVQAEQAAKDANGESNRAAGLAVSVQEAQGLPGFMLNTNFLEKKRSKDKISNCVRYINTKLIISPNEVFGDIMVAAAASARRP